MDFWKLAGILIRRWYILVPTLIVTLVAAFVLAGSVATTYETTGSLVFLHPNVALDDKNQPVPVNPYLSFDASLTITSDAVRRSVESPVERTRLTQQGLSAQYAIEIRPGVPIATVTAEATSPELATATLNGVLARMQSLLEEMQETANAPVDLRIRAQQVGSPSEPIPLNQGKYRMLILVLGAGVLLSVLFTILIDAVLSRSGRGGTPLGGADYTPEERRPYVERPAEIPSLEPQAHSAPISGHTEGSAGAGTAPQFGWRSRWLLPLLGLVALLLLRLSALGPRADAAQGSGCS